MANACSGPLKRKSVTRASTTLSISPAPIACVACVISSRHCGYSGACCSLCSGGIDAAVACSLFNDWRNARAAAASSCSEVTLCTTSRKVAFAARAAPLQPRQKQMALLRIERIQPADAQIFPPHGRIKKSCAADKEAKVVIAPSAASSSSPLRCCQ